MWENGQKEWGPCFFRCSCSCRFPPLSMDRAGEIPPGTEENTLISSPSGVLMEAQTGTVIFEKDKDTRRRPASITKIMTLILIFDALGNGNLNLEDTVTTSAYAKSMGGSQVFLEEGETQDVETMIKCIVVASGKRCQRGHGGTHCRKRTGICKADE